MNNINIFYHIYLFSNWESIVQEQLDVLERSGLLKISKLKVGIVYHGGSENEIEKCVYKLNKIPNCEILFTKHTSYCGECDTLIEMKNFSVNQVGFLLYIHSKGVTQIGSERESYVNDWRRMMEYFLIENWEDCVFKLKDGYDCCGINYQDHAATINNQPKLIKIFNGNFFWVNSEYVKNLDSSILFEHRYSSENWVLSQKHNAYIPFNTPPGFDFYHNSITDYIK